MKKIMYKLEDIMEIGGIKRDIAFLIIGGISLLLSLINSRIPFLHLPFDIAWLAIILCGVPIIIEAIIGLITRFDIKADVLVSLALVASVLIHEDFAAGEVAFIMQLGALLEDLTVARARAGIEKLVHLTPQTARVVRDGKESIIPAEKVQVGEVLRVFPGETIPVDGKLISGETSINQAVMTGESLPVDKRIGDEVFSGTVNQFGVFEMEATKVGEDSSIQRMIRLVQSADADKAKIVRLADRWATWIVVIALSASVLTGIFTGELIRSVTILVVFCPCSLVLATPTAIMAVIGNVTKHGFLVREGSALERLAKVSKITFDKTGTLTCGTPVVTAVKAASEYSSEMLHAYVAAAEQYSEHPLGKAIVEGYGQTVLEANDFSMRPGEGVSAVVEGKMVHAGNEKLLRRYQILIPDNIELEKYEQQGSTIIHVAIDHQYAGYLVLADIVRKEAAGLIQGLLDMNLSPVLLTGDHAQTAQHIADKLGMQEVKADCLPEDKLALISSLQKRGEAICMIGDGINDAPALKTADVGIAMGKIGSDIAVDAADIVLVDDEIKELVHLMAISRRMMRTIKLNLTFSMSLNFVAIILAISGLLGPVVGALVHNAGSVVVIINSAMLLRWKLKER
ncbi:MAG: cation-translocating P-type ATPase [Eubacterium sp.]|nr:cation-translocating P-type ATPase [Eubacterium sp.]